MALYTLLTAEIQLGAAVVLSGYLPLRQDVQGWFRPDAVNLETPVFAVHGGRDHVVPVKAGQEMATVLVERGMTALEFQIIPSLGHAVRRDVFAALEEFLSRLLDPTE